MTAKPLKTIFFDMGGTVLTAHPSVAEIYVKAAARLGYEADVETVNGNFKGAWKRSLLRRAANGHVCDDDLLKEDWCQIVIESFAGILPEEAARRAFEDLYEQFCRADAWNVAEGARPTFEKLRGMGYELGILSNWDHRLEETLEALDILEYFDHRIISFRVGVEKPHPDIFREALRAADTEPQKTLHIGDSYEWDIQPALKLGMRALWLDDGNPMSVVSKIDSSSVHRVGSFPEVLPFIQDLG